MDPASQTGPQFATFLIDGALLAIAAQDVHLALPAVKVAAVSDGGCCRAHRRAEPGRWPGWPATTLLWLFDLDAFLSGIMTAIDTGSQVIVVRHGERSIGLLVSELHGVTRFDPAHVVDTPMAGHVAAACWSDSSSTQIKGAC